MEQIQSYFAEALALLREGYAQVNAIQGLIIALVAAFIMPAYPRIPVFTLGATLAHLALDVMLPVIARGAAFRLPPIFELGYWRDAGVLLLGYFVVISIFYVLRRVLLRR